MSRNPFSAGDAESEEEEGVKKRKLREKEIAVENTPFFGLHDQKAPVCGKHTYMIHDDSCRGPQVEV
jgi:hypothetical protein